MGDPVGLSTLCKPACERLRRQT